MQDADSSLPSGRALNEQVPQIAGSAQSTSAPSAEARFVVGRFYMVPCVRVRDHGAADRHGWIPVHGPEHHDRDVIGFNAMHFHVDVRFVGKREMRNAGSPFHDDTAAYILGYPVSTHSDGKGGYASLNVAHSLRRKLCHRAMPDFPRASAHKWMAKLEDAHKDCKLKPGLICPHRGFSLAEHVKPDGTVICPGHGLRWNVATGELITGSTSGSPARQVAQPSNEQSQLSVSAGTARTDGAQPREQGEAS